MKYVNKINCENSACKDFELDDHLVTTNTMYDEERGIYHTTVTVLNKTNGKVFTTSGTQREEDSFFYKVLAPCYRIACNKVGITPSIEE